MTSRAHSENRELGRAAGVVGKATLASRILGYVRDAVIAAVFGATAGADAFFVAFRVPNLLRRLFAEGSLSAALVPVLTKIRREQGNDEALRLTRAALVCLSAFLTVLAVVGIAGAPLIVRIIGPGFIDRPEQFDLTVTLTRLVFPYILLIGIVAVCMGVLNVFGHFASPALAPVMLNVGIIGAVWRLAPYLETPEISLAAGVIIGGLLQVALQLPFLKRIGLKLGGRWRLWHPELPGIGKRMLPMALGAAAYQLNVVVSTMLATLLPGGGVSYLYYADRLVQFPLGVIAIAAATAALPSFSRLAAEGDIAGLRDSLSFTLRLVFFITLPALVGLIVVREPLVRLLFQRGAFDHHATVMTAEALMYYAAGLWAFSGTRVVVNAYYAMGRVRLPAVLAMIAVAVNVLFSLLLMPRMGHAGLALATSLSSAIHLLFLLIVLRKIIGALDGRRIILSAVKVLTMALAMGGAVAFIRDALLLKGAVGTFGLFAAVAGSVIAGAGVYFLLAKALKCPELSAFLKSIKG